METVIMVLFGVLILAAVAMIVLVLIQDPQSSGLGAGFGSSNAESFFGKNKSQTKESRLAMLTKIDGVLIGVLCLTVAFLIKYI